MAITRNIEANSVNLMDDKTIESYIETSKIWLQSVIIHYNFCPFARREMQRNSIVYYVEQTSDIESRLNALIKQCARLDHDVNSETLLLIYPQGLENFDAYLDFLALAEDLLVAQGYAGIYQLASFHPDYCFNDADTEDPANYTNRSPYPMLHLIREASIERVLESYPHPEKIPQRNITISRQLGIDKMQSMLAQCRNPTKK